jgi:hypothetical protein
MEFVYKIWVARAQSEHKQDKAWRRQIPTMQMNLFSIRSAQAQIPASRFIEA